MCGLLTVNTSIVLSNKYKQINEYFMAVSLKSNMRRVSVPRHRVKRTKAAAKKASNNRHRRSTSKTKPKKRRSVDRRRRTSPLTAKEKCRRRWIKETMGKYKRGKLRFSKSKKNPAGYATRSRKQALAIALSTANRKCGK